MGSTLLSSVVILPLHLLVNDLEDDDHPPLNFPQLNMSFADLEAGQGQPSRTASSSIPQSREDAAFRELQSSLSLQVFKMNANIQSIGKFVDQLGTGKDSAELRKKLYVRFTCCGATSDEPTS